MKFRKKPVIIEAHQWHKNGDHPEDGDTGEGKVVRYFRHPDPQYDGDLIHDDCGHTWHEHGWIDTFAGGQTVCPGDWIVNSAAAGEFYAVRQDKFERSYEADEPKHMTVTIDGDKVVEGLIEWAHTSGAKAY